MTDDPALTGVYAFFTWFIILSQMLPISLLVSSELVKYAQAIFIGLDITMYDAPTDTPAICRTTTLHEDLGQIEYIFSDKTGTLTQNKMEFRVGFVGRVPFGSPDSEIARRLAVRMEILRQQQAGEEVRISHSPWSSHMRSLMARLDGPGTQFDAAEKEKMLDTMWGKDGKGPKDKILAQNTRTFLTHMCISNTITPEQKEEKGVRSFVFNFSSPDELALCKFAQEMGFQFESRSKDGIVMSIDKFGRGRGEIETYQHVATLDFNSKRKRVTLIYTKDQKLYIMCKGADSNIFPLIKNMDAEAQRTKAELNTELVEMAKKGLRTLVVAHAEMPMSWWTGTRDTKGMMDVFASTNLPDRGAEKGHAKGECQNNCRICSGLEEIEISARLSLLGATAIEDKLQDLVPEAIQDFLAAGIKVWMLTGDKRETAKNIGMACNLIDPDMEKIDRIDNTDVENMNRLIQITGDWAHLAHNEQQMKILFSVLTQGDNTGFIERHQLRRFVEGLHIPGLDHEDRFDALWHRVDPRGDGHVSYPTFITFMRSISLSHFKAVQTDIQEGLKRAKRIAGDGSAAEQRANLQKRPISLVVEGEAFAQLYPDADLMKKQRAELIKKLKAEGKSTKLLPHTDVPVEILLLRSQFFELASMAKSVICCRLTPWQKAKIVTEIQLKGNITLAIGDGGNDELMIKKANIGVGISGQEGTAASRAADYAIGQFRYLHTLLFVHGWWSYRRIAKLVCYIFYKAALVALAMYLFGIFSGFSGQQFFNDIIYTGYNVAFTAAPILVLAVLDQGLSRTTLEDDPKAYGAVSHGVLFNDAKFGRWILRSAFHAVLVFGAAVLALGDDIADSNGQNHGVFFTSTVVYASVVMIGTFRIIMEMSTITGIHAFFILLSFFGFYPVILALSTSKTFNVELYGVVIHILSSPTAWLVIFLSTWVPITIDYALLAAKVAWRPTYIDILQERQHLSPERISELDATFALHQQQLATRTSHKVVRRAKKENAKLAEIVAKDEKYKQAMGEDEKQREKQDLAITEALISTLMRFHNLSGSNFDATPARATMSYAHIQRDGSIITAAEIDAGKEIVKSPIERRKSKSRKDENFSHFRITIDEEKSDTAGRSRLSVHLTNPQGIVQEQTQKKKKKMGKKPDPMDEQEWKRLNELEEARERDAERLAHSRESTPSTRSKTLSRSPTPDIEYLNKPLRSGNKLASASTSSMISLASSGTEDEMKITSSSKKKKKPKE